MINNTIKRRVIVYLANLANTGFGCSPSTIPLEVGYIKAYAVSQLSNEVDIQIFRTFESLYSAIQNKKPDIIGCSWYGWNYQLTINALSYIKSRFPDIITVVGGANVPEKIEDCLKDFKEFPCVDIMIPNEGEIPFASLLKVFINGGRGAVFKSSINSVFRVMDSLELTKAQKIAPLVKDINIFPSPYLKGYLDQFLNIGLMPILQTSRGCPFHCSFCVSAKDSWNKLRQFDIERVKEEIDYIGAIAKNRTIRFADENFGIFPRDLEIAEFIAQKREKTGYPSAIRVYTHKEINNNIKRIVLLLRDLIPMNISVQTLTGPVLKNIGRKNIDIDKFREAVNWGHKNSLLVTSEIIFGLPGETYNSFMDVINQLVNLRIDSVSFGTLWMLKETEINRSESINKYGYKILYGIAERGYTKIEQFENLETDSWVVASNTFTFEEFLRINLFVIIYRLFMMWGYLREVVYMWENRGVKIADVISEILDNPVDYPLFSQRVGRLKECLKDNLFETKEQAHKVFSQRLSKDSNTGQYICFMSHFILTLILKGEMIHSLNQDTMINEAIKASVAVFDKNGVGNRDEFLDEMEFAKVLVKNLIIPFWEMPQETVLLSSPYDLIAWRNQDYRGNISEFILPGPVQYRLEIHSFSEYSNFIAENSDKPLYLQSESFFRTFRSNNVRRFITLNEKNKNIKNNCPA